MMLATDRQVGGSHYQGMGMQPIEFAIANGWDAAAFSILKYLSRHAAKNGLQDVQKAGHFIELREQFIEHVIRPGIHVPMADYIARNGLSGETAAALFYLSNWVHLEDERGGMKMLLQVHLDNLIAEYQAGQTSLNLAGTVLP